MPAPFRCFQPIAVLTFVAIPLALLGHSIAAEPEAPTPLCPPVEVSATCIEIDLGALRKLGIEWDISKDTMTRMAKERPNELLAMVKGFANAGCAVLRSEPTLVARLDHQAKLTAGVANVTVKPTTLDAGKVVFDFRFEVRQPVPSPFPNVPPTIRNFRADVGLALKPGEVCCLMHPGVMRPTPLEPSTTTAIFLFVTARDHRPATATTNAGGLSSEASLRR